MQMHACVSLEEYRFPLLPFFVHSLHDRRCAVQNLEKKVMLSRFGTQESFPIASVLLVGLMASTSSVSGASLSLPNEKRMPRAHGLHINQAKTKRMTAPASDLLKNVDLRRCVVRIDHSKHRLYQIQKSTPTHNSNVAHIC